MRCSELSDFSRQQSVEGVFNGSCFKANEVLRPSYGIPARRCFVRLAGGPGSLLLAGWLGGFRGDGNGTNGPRVVPMFGLNKNCTPTASSRPAAAPLKTQCVHAPAPAEAVAALASSHCMAFSTAQQWALNQHQVCRVEQQSHLINGWLLLTAEDHRFGQVWPCGVPPDSHPHVVTLVSSTCVALPRVALGDPSIISPRGRAS
jgi:hypothetical protein